MIDRRSAVLRAVYDASVWVSAFMYPRSVPDQAVDVARKRRVRSILSEPIIDQVERAVLGPRFHRSPAAARDLVAEMHGLSEIVVPTMTLAVITAKESDNRILECAVAGNADVIVTGDRKHLLPLDSYDGIPIVSPADFVGSFER